MKKLTSFAVFSLSLQILFSVNAFAQSESDCRPVKYMRQAMENVIVKAKTVNNISEFGFHKNVCIMGARLPVGNSVDWTTTLQAGTTYMFIGGGDNDVTDLDIYLYDKDGNEVKRDDKNDKTPIVQYRPLYSGEFTVKVKMYASKGSGSFAGMAIMSDKGYNIPLSNLTAATSALFSPINKLSGSPKVTNMSFLDTKNQWALFGRVLEDGESTTLLNMKLGDSTNAIVGSADDDAEDIDMYLYDDEGNLADKDEKPDKQPIIAHIGSKGGPFGVKIKNVESQGDRSLVMIALLQLKINVD